MANLNSKKRAPKMKDPEIQLVINRIYDHINELVDAVNSATNETFSEGAGKPGDIRVGENSDRTVSIEIRTEDGWFQLGGFTMIEKRG